MTLYRSKNKYSDGLYLFTTENNKITWLCDYDMNTIPSYESAEKLLEKEAAEIIKDATPMYYDDNIGELRDSFDEFCKNNEIEERTQESFEIFAKTFEDVMDNIEVIGEF